jgi:hypothetical protein
MTNDELDELRQVESHLQWLLDLVQRRIDACGQGEGLNNAARQAEALAGIAEEKRIAAEEELASLLPSTAAELEEVAWLERHIRQVTPTLTPQQRDVPQCVSSTVAGKVKKSAKSS